MITLNVFFDVDPKQLPNFIALLTDMVTKSSAEAGNSYYHLLKDETQTNRYTLIEHWHSQADLDAHQKTDHWQHFDATVNDYLTHKYEEHHYTELPLRF